MHISAVEEYGLRCALQLASLEEGSVLAASQIAEREGISVQYASKIMHLFRKANLVNASRGMQGGFRLGKPAAQIPLKAVFASLREEEEMSSFCNNYKGLQDACVHLNSCSVRPVWHVLSSYFDSVLERLTLADLARPEADSRKRIEEFAKNEADRIRDRFAAGERAPFAPPFKVEPVLPLDHASISPLPHEGAHIQLRQQPEPLRATPPELDRD